MARITSENKSELKKITNELRAITVSLQNLYSRVTKIICFLCIYMLLWGITIFFNFYFAQQISNIIILTSLVINVISFGMSCMSRKYLLYQYVIRYNTLYEMGLQKLEVLINYVDWSVFRKHQLYNDNDPIIDEVILSFLTTIKKPLVPIKSNCLYSWILRGLIALSYFIFIMTTIICIYNIVIS